MNIGDAAPTFDVQTDTGARFSLRGVLGRWVIVWFFPESESIATDTQARGFERLLESFIDLNAVIVGVSIEPREEHIALRSRNHLTYPLYGLRQLERGYNQSEILAQGVAKALNAPVLEALGRTRSTKRQARLEKTDRIDNIRDAFEVCKNVTGLELILVDDVHTTGSTLNEASLELIRAGAKRVRIAVIART